MKAVVCHETKLVVEEVPDPVPGPGQVLLEVVRGGICGSDLHARKHADELADLAAGDRVRRRHAAARVGRDGPRVQRPGARLRPLHEEGLADRHAGRLAADDPDGRPGADDRPVGQGARCVRRAAARPGVPHDGGAQRSRPGDRSPDRADGGRLARRTPQRGAQEGDRGRDRLRPDRAGGDPDAQGAWRADGDRQRLLAGPPCAGRAVRCRRGRRPGGGLTVEQLRGEQLHHRRQRPASTSRSARWASCARCRSCRGPGCCARPRRPARPPAARSSSSASACRGSSTRSSTPRPSRRASWWSGCAWSPTRSGRRWRSTRRSSCGSSSPTSRTSSTRPSS